MAADERYRAAGSPKRDKNDGSIEGDGFASDGDADGSVAPKKIIGVKSSSGGGKSRSRTTVGRESPTASPSTGPIEPIVAPAAIALDDLKDGYYRELRSLVPPHRATDPGGEETRMAGGGGGVVRTPNARLCELHDAIDEIGRAVDEAHVTLLRLDRPDDTGTAVLPVGERERLPFSDRRPKPDSGIESRPYRLRTAVAGRSAGPVNAPPEPRAETDDHV